MRAHARHRKERRERGVQADALAAPHQKRRPFIQNADGRRFAIAVIKDGRPSKQSAADAPIRFVWPAAQDASSHEHACIHALTGEEMP
eukprot:1916884-Pleurochrysis_carterae.AAC.2